ncbi:MAG: Asp-tRNA(Asn)/Glu-tRNA(Gln) amidotransferase subunit GatA [Gemmatimonadetes bacterium]|nr:Asp-tRNA(Asn)/Glu-tRNA(Gln) amidotransferase subunit GatA [Gemmatimonadota bacterium]
MSDIASIAEAVRHGEVDPAEPAIAAVARLHEQNGGPRGLNAFLAALSNVEASALEVSRDRGRLPGVPIAVKDNMATVGFPTTCGSKILEGYQSPYEATVVRRLREEGAVIVGKTNLDEFAMGSSTENSAYGPVRNPRDPSRVPGGSSGGSAAAVAAGIVPAALGSDTGGSVRQPASFCGVVGIKPTYGRVSRYGLVAFASSLDQVGMFGSTVADAAELLQVVAGHDPRDSTSVDRPVPDFSDERDTGAEGLVVGVPTEYFGDALEAGVQARCQTALDTLEANGAEIREVSLPNTRYALAAYYVIATAEASSNLSRFDGVRYGLRDSAGEDLSGMYEGTRTAGFGPEVKRRILLGTFALTAGYHDQYYGRAQRARSLVSADFETVFGGGVDILFTPTSPTVAFPLGERVQDPLQMYLADVFTVTANLAGLPAISVPVGTSDGLPVGGQLIAPKWREATLFRAAFALESALENGDRDE